MNEELQRLVRQLRRQFCEFSPDTPLSRVAPETLQSLNDIRRALTPLKGRFSDARIAQGVTALRIQGDNTRYPDIKYACYGIARRVDWDGRILLAEAAELACLLRRVAHLKSENPQHHAACLDGLRQAIAQDLAQSPELLTRPEVAAGLAEVQRALSA